MINADEHQKLLAKVEELERTSTNFFDVEKEFFLIDSDNLAEVKTRLYGYSIQATGIYEQDNLTEEAVAGLDGRGCYVYVEAKDGQITIKQDLNGCWGLYLFRYENYFALSNSFFRLLDHVKFRYPLTVNRDFCHYLMTDILCNNTYSDTAVNEIELLDRGAVVHIAIAEKNFQIEQIDRKEHTILLNTEEGIATLDRWIGFWGDVFRGLSQNTKFLVADLSGGFDSRVAFVTLLHSGIDMNKIRINSTKDDLYTHKEDYAVASKIAAHYGFELNKPFPARQFLNYSLADVWNIDLYNQQTFSNLPRIFDARKNLDRLYYLKGQTGESIREYWHMSPENFIRKQDWKTAPYSFTLSYELLHSFETILNKGFRATRDKYQIQDENSADIPQCMYHETWSRHHHGKEPVGYFLKNMVSLAPAVDPDLLTLKLYTPECLDPNLLIALIFTRYEPDLLKFPFVSQHAIAPETIDYARNLNARFQPPATVDNVDGKVFHLQPRDLQVEQLLAKGTNNKNIPRNLLKNCIKAMFESSRTHGLFTAYFSEEFYQYATEFYENPIFSRERPMYSILGITRVLEDVEISNRNHTRYRDMQRFLKQDFCQIHKDNKVTDKFAPYLTARIDIKLISNTETETFDILSISDKQANLSKPAWFNKDGTGYIISSCTGEINFVVKANVDGQIKLILRGKYVVDSADTSKLVPYWIDYTKLVTNGKTIFNNLTPAWHNKPYSYNLNVKAGEEVKVQIEWLPHRSDT